MHMFNDGIIIFCDEQIQIHVIKPRRLLRILRRAFRWPSEHEFRWRRRERRRRQQQQQQQQQQYVHHQMDQNDDDSVICLD